MWEDEENLALIQHKFIENSIYLFTCERGEYGELRIILAKGIWDLIAI